MSFSPDGHSARSLHSHDPSCGQSKDAQQIDPGTVVTLHASSFGRGDAATQLQIPVLEWHSTPMQTSEQLVVSHSSTALKSGAPDLNCLALRHVVSEQQASISETQRAARHGTQLSSVPVMKTGRHVSEASG